MDYNIHDGFPYNLEKLCVPKGERLQLMRAADTSKFVLHFGVRKIVSNLQLKVCLFVENASICISVHYRLMNELYTNSMLIIH